MLVGAMLTFVTHVFFEILAHLFFMGKVALVSIFTFSVDLVFVTCLDLGSIMRMRAVSSVAFAVDKLLADSIGSQLIVIVDLDLLRRLRDGFVLLSHVELHFKGEIIKSVNGRHMYIEKECK